MHGVRLLEIVNFSRGSGTTSTTTAARHVINAWEPPVVFE